MIYVQSFAERRKLDRDLETVTLLAAYNVGNKLIPTSREPMGFGERPPRSVSKETAPPALSL